MKKTYIVLLGILLTAGLNLNIKAQLSGTKTIPGDYSSIANAATALNANGVGAGGVVFDIAAGHTETVSNLVISITTNLPTAANPVVFQKSGTGANPLITAAAGASPTIDGIIKLNGTDYTTFDGIDLLDPTSNTGDARMEWGFVFLRVSTSNGCQNNVIRNCNITLQKENTASIGIFISKLNLAGSIITANSSSGRNSYNKVYGNNITNVDNGITVNAEAFSSLGRDEGNEIGMNGFGANNITNWGDDGDQVVEAIKCQNQLDLKINNNVIAGGNDSTIPTSVINISTSASSGQSNLEVSYNQISINSLGDVSCIIGGGAAYDSVRIHNNIVENCNVSGSFTAIGVIPASNGRAFVHNNTIRNNTFTLPYNNYLIGAFGAFHGGNLSIHSNQIYGNQNISADGRIYCIYIESGAVECYSNTVFNNSIPNSSGTLASSIYGYLNGGATPSQKIYNNTFSNLSIGGSNTAANTKITGIVVNGQPSTLTEIYGNLVSGLSGPCGSGTSGGVRGIYVSFSSNIHNNKIYDLTNTSTTGITIGCQIEYGTQAIYNNFISSLYAPIQTTITVL